MLFKSPGKVNMALDILSREKAKNPRLGGVLSRASFSNKSGYHLLETVYQELEHVFDEIEVKRREVKGVEIRCEVGEGVLGEGVLSMKVGGEVIGRMPEYKRGASDGCAYDVGAGCEKRSMIASSKAKSRQEIPLDESNTMHKAVSLLAERFSVKQGVLIFLKKMIPVGGGLGGGSSNAACVMRALNQLWKLDLSANELRRLGAEIGMDVPFFIEGGTAVGRHFGEEIEVLPALRGLDITVKTPPAVRVNTGEAYGMLDLNRLGKRRADTAGMIRLIKGKDFVVGDFPDVKEAGDSSYLSGKSIDFKSREERFLPGKDFRKLFSLIHNDFETVIYERYPEIAACRDALKDAGFSFVCLSGSGSSVFGVR